MQLGASTIHDRASDAKHHCGCFNQVWLMHLRCIDRMALDPNYPYSLGARCINKDWFGMPMDDVRKIMEENLHFCAHAFEIKIYLFVLMSNHYHLIAEAPLGNLSACMQYLQASTSRQITKSAGRINHTWRAKFFRTLMGSHHYYLNAYKYFYRNPVAAGICNRVEDYRYSKSLSCPEIQRLAARVSLRPIFFEIYAAPNCRKGSDYILGSYFGIEGVAKAIT